MESWEKTANRGERPPGKLASIVDGADLRRALVTFNDNPALQQELTRCLSPIAGQTLPPIAVAGTIILAIDRYTKGDANLPSSQLARLFIPHIVEMIVPTRTQRDAVLQELGVISPYK